MRNVAMSALVACISAACSPALDTAVSPGPIVDTNGIVTSSFVLIPGYDVNLGSGPPIHIGTLSEGYGGACLFTDLGRPRIGCNTNDDCKALNNTIAGGFAECLSPNEASEPKACWYKGRDREWCNKHPPPPLGSQPPFEIGVRNPVPQDYIKGDITYTGGIRSGAFHPGVVANYIIAACVNGMDNGQSVPHCGTGGPKRVMVISGPIQVLGRDPPPGSPLTPP